MGGIVRHAHGFAVAALSSILLLGPMLPSAAHAQSFHQLFAFQCTVLGKPPHQTTSCPQGSGPGFLLQSVDGNFYGTTGFGGSGNQATGTVFRITPSGKLTTLYTFIADSIGSFPNGANPGGMVEGNDGFLYGTAAGSSTGAGGVIFKLSKTGALQVLHKSSTQTPYSLTLGADGNLYGCTPVDSILLSGATVFQLTPAGVYTTLHTFDTPTEGPGCIGITLASDGNFYGTTIGDVRKITTLFRLTPAGQFTILQTIHYGQFPVGAPIQAADAKIYGALDFVENGGPFVPGLFASEPSGAGYQQIGLSYPVLDWVGNLTDASDGNFWAIDLRLGPSGSLVSFAHDGSPLRQVDFGGFGLSQISNGTFLAVAGGGIVPPGEVAGGSIVTINAGLPAPKPLFVTPRTLSGIVGSKVMIHGRNFLGTTRVTFHGVSASFQILNTGNILATVPAGATTGPIAVTNAGGTADSQTDFTVP